jgi:hypothetical protein
MARKLTPAPKGEKTKRAKTRARRERAEARERKARAKQWARTYSKLWDITHDAHDLLKAKAWRDSASKNMLKARPLIAALYRTLTPRY